MGVRFRYPCENKRSVGSIIGAHSTAEHKTYPTIRIDNFTGKVTIVVSCVTIDTPHRPHPYSLVGRKGCFNGVFNIMGHVDENANEYQFKHIGIQCVKLNNIESALRTRADIRVDPYRTGFEHAANIRGIILGAVRLAFQVFLLDEDGHVTSQLPPVVSDIIYDKKIPGLHIVRTIGCSGFVTAGTELGLLCEKVTAGDKVVVCEEDEFERVRWEQRAHVVAVYKQMAVVFVMPTYDYEHYHPQTHTGPIHLNIHLINSENKRSNSIPVEYYPNIRDWVTAATEPPPVAEPQVLQQQVADEEIPSVELMSGSLEVPFSKVTEEWGAQPLGGDEESPVESLMEAQSAPLDGGGETPYTLHGKSVGAPSPDQVGICESPSLSTNSPQQYIGNEPYSNALPLDMHSPQLGGGGWMPFVYGSVLGAQSMHQGVTETPANGMSPGVHSPIEPPTNACLLHHTHNLNQTQQTPEPMSAQRAVCRGHVAVGSRFLDCSGPEVTADYRLEQVQKIVDSMDLPSEDLSLLLEKVGSPAPALCDLISVFSQDDCESLSASLRRLSTNS